MTRKLAPGEKPLYWIGSSLKDINGFPADVRRKLGFALSAAQYGGKDPSAKPWKGEGAGSPGGRQKLQRGYVPRDLHRSFC